MIEAYVVWQLKLINYFWKKQMHQLLSLYNLYPENIRKYIAQYTKVVFAINICITFRQRKQM